MANSITPDVTIYLYNEEVKDVADYTIIQNIDDEYIQSLPLGLYYFKVEGTYDGTPIAEEYKSINITENSIIDWNGEEFEKDGTIQEFIFTCYLAISLLTVNVEYDSSAYVNATVEVGEVNDNYHPREAVHTTDGAYTVDNIRRNTSLPVKVIPSDSDTYLGTETKQVQIGSSSTAIDIELFFYFNVRILAYEGNTRIYPSEGFILDLEGNIITEMNKVSGALLTDNPIKKGNYIIKIPGYTIPRTTDSYKTYEAEHYLEKSTASNGLKQLSINMELGGESEEDPTPTPSF